MKQSRLNEILRLHSEFLENENKGAKANLQMSDLRDAELNGADLRGADLNGADLNGADLRGADLRGADIDNSCLPLWGGGQFKTDLRVCKQLVAHVVRIMELSEIKEPELIEKMNQFKKGWHMDGIF